jgi:hypothetical protein
MVLEPWIRPCSSFGAMEVELLFNTSIYIVYYISLNSFVSDVNDTDNFCSKFASALICNYLNSTHMDVDPVYMNIRRIW